MLRKQQEREYKEAEEADRKERERKENEKNEKEKKIFAEQQAMELKEAIELSQRLTYESMIHRKKALIKPEPEEGPDIATIRFQLPKSSKITRRFHRSDLIENVSNYLVVYFFDTGSNVKNFSLSTHFPKQELTDMSAAVDSVVRMNDPLVMNLINIYYTTLIEISCLSTYTNIYLFFSYAGPSSSRNALCQ